MYTLLSFGTQYFIYNKLRKAGVSKLIRYLFVIWALLIAVAGYVFGYDLMTPEADWFPMRLNEIVRALSVTWSIITILGFFSFLVTDLFTGFKDFTKRKALFAFILTLAGTLYCMGEAYYVQRRDVTITTTKLPEDIDSIRLVYVTDAHIGGLATHWHFERVMRIVEEARPDILALCGDIIDGDMSYRERELALLIEAAGRAKYGAFAVNGNHEYYFLLDEDVEQIIRDCGYKLLINERAETAGITIIGIDDTAFNTYIEPVLDPKDSERFVLVLKHRPKLPEDAQGRFDLQISGHTHGGQFWPLGYFKDMAGDSTQGLSRKAGGYVYVSNGSGFNGAMMRMFVPPEVTVIDIVKE